MTSSVAENFAELPCHKCGYDLRAHPPDGKCPECGASVAEARKEAAIPSRPAWRDSDPRWRRRMLAGVWVLVLVPLMDVLVMSGWASSIPVPNIFGYGAIRTLDETLVSGLGVYKPIVFCIGVVLLFSKERGRRRGWLDWTRRWGVICSYIVALLSAASFLILPALVMAGIAAMFLCMPRDYQPRVTQLFVEVSYVCLRYGPYPKEIAEAVHTAFSSITILLACAALFDALRSSGPKPVARILLIPLGFVALMHIGQAAWFCLRLPGVTSNDVYLLETYFRPDLLVRYIAGVPVGWGVPVSGKEFAVEVLKWCSVLAIAVWLSIAQFAASRQRKKVTPR
jgi:hypothetical protein